MFIDLKIRHRVKAKRRSFRTGLAKYIVSLMNPSVYYGYKMSCTRVKLDDKYIDMESEKPFSYMSPIFGFFKTRQR